MPFGKKVECDECHVTKCLLWYRELDHTVCNDCYDRARAKKAAEEVKEEQPTVVQEATKTVRKSTRITRNYRTRQNPDALPKQASQKGKGRRSLFKKTPVKAPSAVATVVTGNRVNFKGTYFHTGDIVSVRDVEGGLYYAQIRGLMIDQYAEKSAALTWLIPTTKIFFGNGKFKPSDYVLGPDEEVPRKLGCLEFVMHAPCDYYALSSPYPPVTPHPSETNFIWGRLTYPPPVIE